MSRKTPNNSIQGASQLQNGTGHVRGLHAGQWFELTQHPRYTDISPETRQFTISRIAHSGINNLPVQFLGNYVGQLSPQLAQQSQTLQKDTGIYTNHFTVHPQTTPYRPAQTDGHGRQLHPQPTVRGVHTAIVTAPSGEEVHTERGGRVKVKFHWDRENQANENSYAWVRPAQLWAGDNYGAVHTPRAGQEVLVEFVEGDADRPVIVASLYNGANHPNWHNPGVLAGTKSKSIKGSGHNRAVFDDSSGQVRTTLASSKEVSEINLGYLIHQQDNVRGGVRGQGFETRTNAWAAVRAGKGLLLTTQTASLTSAALQNASSQSSLAQASEQAKSQAELTGKHSATPAQSEAALSQHSAELQPQESDQGFQQSHLHVHGEAGVGISANEHLQTHAGKSLTQTAAQSITHSAAQNIHLVAAKGTSVFAYKEAMQMHAVKGQVSIKQHQGTMQLAADKDLKIQSMSAPGTVSAKSELHLASKQGAFIKLSNNIQIYSPSKVSFLGLHSFSGPARANAVAASLGSANLAEQKTNIQYVMHDDENKPFKNQAYIFIRENGQIEHGTTNASGMTAVHYSEAVEKCAVHLLQA